MKLVYTLFIVGISTTLLLTAATFTNQISLQIHQNPFVNNLAKYQFFALAVGILATIAVLILDPASKQFLSAGNLNVIAGKDKWLGINGNSSWRISKSRDLQVPLHWFSSRILHTIICRTNSCSSIQRFSFID